jgi:hypothetical protein
MIEISFMQVPEHPERNSVAFGHATEQLLSLLLFERGLVAERALETVGFRATNCRCYEVTRRAFALFTTANAYI